MEGRKAKGIDSNKLHNFRPTCHESEKATNSTQPVPPPTPPIPKPSSACDHEHQHEHVPECHEYQCEWDQLPSTPNQPSEPSSVFPANHSRNQSTRFGGEEREGEKVLGGRLEVICIHNKYVLITRTIKFRKHRAQPLQGLKELQDPESQTNRKATDRAEGGIV